VPEQQAAASNPEDSVVPPTTATTEAFPSGTPTTFDALDPDARLDALGGIPTGDDEDSSSVTARYLVEPITRIAPVLLAAALAYLVLFPIGLLVWRALRRRGADSPRDQIELAWAETVEDASLVGYAETESDTYVERAHHLAAALGDGADEALALARCRETAAYSPAGADDDDVVRAQAAADELGTLAKAKATRRSRVGRWIDPRALVRGWRQDHSARQRRITLTARGDLEQERELVGSGDRG
jgi:hypothetical protein